MKTDIVNSLGQMNSNDRISVRNIRDNFLEILKKSFVDIEQNIGAPHPKENALSSGSESNPSLVHLGTISQNYPTVSNLLIKHPAYKHRCWQIIHSEMNQYKPFTKIQLNTEIYLNPDTLEIVWKGNGYTPHREELCRKSNLDLAIHGETNDFFSEKLADAVTPFIGMPYKEVDCYELIINGLKKLGVQYYGQGGLKEKLIKTAEKKGFSENALLTGEGLIEVTGTTIYEKSIPLSINSENMVHEVMEELNPKLKRGLVLSFSTPTRGHTGIVSGKEGLWTYINSGRLDHHIGNPLTQKGVGEESLDAELRNWFELAAGRRESLQITLGRLDGDKLAMLTDVKPEIASVRPEMANLPDFFVGLKI